MNPPPGEFARRYRRRLHRHNEAMLRRLLADPAGSLDSYETAYRASFAGTVPVAASDRELIEECRHRRVVILGDFHTFSRVASRSLELTAAIHACGEPVALALEIFAANGTAGQQDGIAAYLRGQISLDALRAATRFDRQWGAPLWAHYAPVLAWARRHRVPVAGINLPGATLAERDHAAAHAVRRLARRHTDRKIVVLMGELHTAPGHLPARLRETGGYSPLIVHQSAEPIAWRLEKNGIFAEWIRLGPGRYARQVAHPLVHQSTFTYHVLSAEHPEPVDNWERAFRYTAKRLGDLAGLDIRGTLDRMHIWAGAGGEAAVSLTDADGTVPPLELALDPQMDELAAGAARAVVRFTRYLNTLRRASPDAAGLAVREETASQLARLWINPHSARELPSTGAAELARRVDLSLAGQNAAAGTPPVLRNLFLGTGYPRETDRELLHRIEKSVAGTDAGAEPLRDRTG